MKEPVEDAGAVWALHSFAGGGFLCGDDGWFLTQDAIDALVEEAEHVGGVVETVHVIRDADLLVVARGPFLDQFLGRVAHAVEYLSRGFGTHQRRHDAVRDTPDVILGVIRRKQTVVHSGANLNHGTGYAFPEASLVTDFFQVSGVGDKDKLVTEDFDAEDGA